MAKKARTDATAIYAGRVGKGGLTGQVSKAAEKRRAKGASVPASKAKAKGSRRNSRANAEPSGGGGGVWAKTNKKMGESRRELRDGEAGLTFGSVPDYGLSKGAPPETGTSIFDPVLAELIYRWFSPLGGRVLDPFAGGSVRGVVASHLGRNYVGVDLRPEQVAANLAQLGICREPAPEWIEGDARDIDKLLGRKRAPFDLVFSCPPYGDLERYSDDPRDLSTMEYDAFLDALQEIVGKSCAALATNRFACFVVGDFRDQRGAYRAFPAHVIDMFQSAGLDLYNDAVLITAVGSLPARTRIQFETSRKLGKTHQNVLVFCKGDAKRAAEEIGAVEFGDGPAAPGEEAKDGIGGEV